MRSLSREQSAATLLVGGVMVAALILLVMRSAGLYPSIMADEYIYNTMSRLKPIASAEIPDYLYLSVFRLTSLCGDGYLECARILNTLFFVCSAPFIYLVARRFCGFRISLLIVVISMLGPVNGYTAYYMPEALFFLSFWVAIAYFLNFESPALLRRFVILGAMVGAASLIKPHALFMVPAFCVSIIFFSYYDSVKNWFVKGIIDSSIFGVFVFLTKFVIGYLIAGKAGLTLFGNFYTSNLESNASSLQRYLDIISASPPLVVGHMLATILMFGAAVAVVMFGVVRSFARKISKPEDKLAFCIAMLLLNLIAVVALFTASVAGTTLYETAFRLHMRYYDFLFPLLFVAIGSQIRRTHEEYLKYWRYASAVLVIAAICYAATTKMLPFMPSYVDGPEIRGYTLNAKLFMVLAGLSVFSVVLWVRSARDGALFFMFLYLPLSVVVTTIYNNVELRSRMTIDTYDKAGIFTKNYVPSNELAKLVVVGDDVSSIFRVLFHLDNVDAVRDASYIPGVSYTAAQMPPNKKWVLAVGDVDFAKDDFEVKQLNGFSLARKGSAYPIIIDFSSGFLPYSVSHVSGMSHSENWGAWSSASVVTMKFVKPLPEKFELILNAKAFGPNDGKVFNLSIDGRSYPVKLSATSGEYKVNIENPNSVNVLSVVVPFPTSPKQLGMSEDARILGIGIEKVEISKIQ
ncbi:glycosyltransferase family 39 protein [Pseudomonas sp. MF6747]|nr:glycosyltransferase family 39 protein [Pseudomonas sp. MF6747]